MIEVRDVHKWYIRAQGYRKEERVYALRGVSAQFATGKVFAIFGDSGSGKTTLGNLISGYLTPDAGSIFYDGSSERSARRVRQIFQDPYLSLNPAKDVGWHIETAARLNRIDPEDVWAVFESTRLAKGKFESRLTSTLSGGERQMLAFSMALAQQPDCLVLDEPFSYLDTLNRFRMLSLLRKTKDRILHIYVDNDIDRCAYVSDFIYILKSGQVIEQGTPERIIDSPREEFTREVVRNRLDMKSRKLVTGNDSPFRSALSA